MHALLWLIFRIISIYILIVLISCLPLYPHKTSTWIVRMINKILYLWILYCCSYEGNSLYTIGCCHGYLNLAKILNSWLQPTQIFNEIFNFKNYNHCYLVLPATFILSCSIVIIKGQFSVNLTSSLNFLSTPELIGNECEEDVPCVLILRILPKTIINYPNYISDRAWTYLKRFLPYPKTSYSQRKDFFICICFFVIEKVYRLRACYCQ